MKKVFVLILITISINLFAQTDTLEQYRGEKTKYHDLIHTKLKVNFDFEKRQMNGEAWITATPYFYSAQDFVLDAKYMLIHEVKMLSRTLEYDYDNEKLTIHLGNAYARGEQFEIYIKYTARPEEVKAKGSAVITDAKGLYFIDPDGTDPNRPTEIWTQGATESSSCWFPTIDSPNQNTTQEIYITVPDKYTTLSNGTLVSKEVHSDETRTDYWVMEKPHAPYLFFMGIGEYSVTEDSWNGIDVNYYVEKEYAQEAQTIFGNTPEMIQFFSDKFGVAYPWDKYSQIVGSDFVSGAMENTTATIHSEPAYQKAGELVDQNTWEDVISHELVHQWFGDLVTTESWSNITVNESFATYGEYLWREYKYGKMHADAHLFEDKLQYIMGDNEAKNLVRFHYEDRDDVFDGVSYQKGANILHMLRNYLGDDAFFEGLKHYLTKHQYNTAEAHQLRIALEEVSGRDLNPFFNQWYYKNGHPKLEVSYEYKKPTGLTVNVKQIGKVFESPLVIAIYENGKATDYTVDLNKDVHSFSFKTSGKPDLVNVNANHVLLCTLTDKSKTLEEYIFQYNNAPHFVDKQEAIKEMAAHQDDKNARKTLLNALKDKYHGLRVIALNAIDLKQNKKAIAVVKEIANTDEKTLVQAVAIEKLRNFGANDIAVYQKGLNSPSYAVQINSILGLYKTEQGLAKQAIANLKDADKEYMASQLAIIFVAENDVSQMPNIAKGLLDTIFKENPTADDQQNFMKTFSWIASSDNKTAYEYFVADAVSKGKRYKKYGVDKMAMGLLSQMIQVQKATDNTNKEELLGIVKNGLTMLTE